MGRVNQSPFLLNLTLGITLDPSLIVVFHKFNGQEQKIILILSYLTDKGDGQQQGEARLRPPPTGGDIAVEIIMTTRWVFVKINYIEEQQ